MPQAITHALVPITCFQCLIFVRAIEVTHRLGVIWPSSCAILAHYEARLFPTATSHFTTVVCASLLTQMTDLCTKALHKVDVSPVEVLNLDCSATGTDSPIGVIVGREGTSSVAFHSRSNVQYHKSKHGEPRNRATCHDICRCHNLHHLCAGKDPARTSTLRQPYESRHAHLLGSGGLHRPRGPPGAHPLRVHPLHLQGARYPSFSLVP